MSLQAAAEKIPGIVVEDAPFPGEKALLLPVPMATVPKITSGACRSQACAAVKDRDRAEQQEALKEQDPRELPASAQFNS